MANYLITGGAGFIGSNLINNLLKDSNNIIVIDNLITGDLDNIRKFKNESNFEFIKFQIGIGMICMFSFNDFKKSTVDLMKEDNFCWFK